MSDFTFPVIANANPVKYPLSRTVTFNTAVARFLDDSEQRYARRRRLDVFAIQFTRLPKSELDRLYSFWEDVRGPLVPWKITIDGVLYDNCKFLGDDFVYEEPELFPNLYTVSLSVKQTVSNFLVPAGEPGDFPAHIADSLGGTRSFQRPIRTTSSLRTALVDMPISGLRYGYPLRNDPIETPAHVGLYVWNVNLALETASILTVENHFVLCRGRWKRFGFTDPHGHHHPDCRYATDTLEITYAGPNDTQLHTSIEQFTHHG